MDKYIIQSKNGEISRIKEFELIKELERHTYLRNYTYILSETSVRPDIADYTPVGTIEFVEEHLREYHNVEFMKPIEVPEELRTPKYLKRRYSIVSKEDLQDEGYWFIRKIDRLKEFTNTGCVGLYKNSLDDGTYVVSDVVDILSEYRVFVINDVIQGIQFYQGDCLVFPDVEIIKDAVDDYSKVSSRPRAYTIDIAVSTIGTLVIEVHSFVSCGTYGLSTDHLARMYKLGYEYYTGIMS